MCTLKLILKKAGYPVNLTIYWKRGEAIAGTRTPLPTSSAQSTFRDRMTTLRDKGPTNINISMLKVLK